MCNKRSHLSDLTFTLISYVEALNDIKFKDSLFLRVKVFLFYEEWIYILFYCLNLQLFSEPYRSLFLTD